jgi:hypothetical protein
MLEMILFVVGLAGVALASHLHLQDEEHRERLEAIDRDIAAAREEHRAVMARMVAEQEAVNGEIARMQVEIDAAASWLDEQELKTLRRQRDKYDGTKSEQEH